MGTQQRIDRNNAHLAVSLVAYALELKAEHILLPDRGPRDLVRARQIAMYLSKIMTLRSLPEIGRRFGGRDHTTILHAVRKAEELKDGDAKLAKEIELLRRLIEE